MESIKKAMRQTLDRLDERILSLENENLPEKTKNQIDNLHEKLGELRQSVAKLHSFSTPEEAEADVQAETAQSKD